VPLNTNQPANLLYTNEGEQQSHSVSALSEWAICDFQWGDGRWTRRGDNRWATTARGLNRDQIDKIARFAGSKNFVGKKKKVNCHSVKTLQY